MVNYLEFRLEVFGLGFLYGDAARVGAPDAEISPVHGVVCLRNRGNFFGNGNFPASQQERNECHPDWYPACRLLKIPTPRVGIKLVGKLINPGQRVHHQRFAELLASEQFLIHYRAFSR
ncbi:hypothetical protein ES703_71543 [subsurface metagenome]